MDAFASPIPSASAEGPPIHDVPLHRLERYADARAHKRRPRVVWVEDGAGDRTKLTPIYDADGEIAALTPRYDDAGYALPLLRPGDAVPGGYAPSHAKLLRGDRRLYLLYKYGTTGLDLRAYGGFDEQEILEYVELLRPRVAPTWMHRR